ncbi:MULTISPECIES: hypothetical protein [Anaerolinea]|jgi:hypothetical protein|uniref:hypothetical protein n=1 Tax=Anaerolinea TaxID=233189 RepID=UPI002627C48F|nr:hypothetical protein [Anaerolinea thermophila]
MSDEPKPLDALTPEEPPAQPESGESETPELFTPPPLDASSEPYTPSVQEEPAPVETPFAPPEPAAAPAGTSVPPAQPKKGLAWWVIVLIVLVVLCCCCVATGLIGWGLYRMLEESGAISALLLPVL